MFLKQDIVDGEERANAHRDEIGDQQLVLQLHVKSVSLRAQVPVVPRDSNSKSLCSAGI
jgi:hypothetical protein